MRIAQVSPLWEKVPPPSYGGVESIVSLLTEELVRRGHEVTLFASGDSTTCAKLESVYPRALRSDKMADKYEIYGKKNIDRVYNQADNFDIIHSHLGCEEMVYANIYTKRVKTPTIQTIHGAFTSHSRQMFAQVGALPLVSISNAQRDQELKLNYTSTIYNGIDPTAYIFQPQRKNPPYLAFLGRMSPEKGPHLAIAIAKQSGLPLKMAGKIDVVDKDFFEEQIQPHLDGEQIEYIGETNHEDKVSLLGNALATLFPITWQEPFGLVMIESMVTGTPVIAINLGSAGEVIAEGKTGFVCDTVEDCVQAVEKVKTLNRQDCHNHVLENFTAEKMTDQYEALYQKILTKKPLEITSCLNVA